MITIPKSAQPEMAFGGHKTLFLPNDDDCKFVVVFDTEFDVIQCIPYHDPDNFEQFSTLAELNEFLFEQGIGLVDDNGGTEWVSE